MIKQLLKDLVERYQEEQFLNKDRDIGFFKARREILSCGSVFFYDEGSTQPKIVTTKEGDILPNPIYADYEGRFPEISGKGMYRIQVEGRSGNPLVTVDRLKAVDHGD